MDNEKFQELVLQQLKMLSEGQNMLIHRVGTLEQGQNLLAANLMETQKNVKELTTQVGKLENQMARLETRIENEIIEKIRGLYDFREVQNNVNERITSTLERIEAKIDVLQMETAHIRRVK
ncbi:MAG: hypothetical protein HPY81_06280 [Firmicutes bacterium]|nr:hypothetical protein [Bacillota bacterium]